MSTSNVHETNADEPQIVIPYPECGSGSFSHSKQLKGQLANALSAMVQRSLWSVWRAARRELFRAASAEIHSIASQHGVMLSSHVVLKVEDWSDSPEFQRRLQKTFFGYGVIGQDKLMGCLHHVYFVNELPAISYSGAAGFGLLLDVNAQATRNTA